jgi:hypothetical protein
MALRMLRSAEGGTHEREFGPAAQSGLETTVARAVGVYPEGPASWDVEVGCPELQIYISFVAGFVHVTLSAIDKGLTSRIGTNSTGGILAICKRTFDQTLYHRFLSVIYLNNFLTLPLDFEFKVFTNEKKS